MLARNATLGAAGVLGGLLGGEQFLLYALALCDFDAQLLNVLLERVAGGLHLPAASLDLSHHFVEAIHQDAQLVFADFDGAQGVVSFGGNAAGHFGKLQHRLRNNALQFGREQERRQRGRQQYGEQDASVALQARVHISQISLYVDGADALPIQNDLLKQDQVTVPKLGAVLSRPPRQIAPRFTAQVNREGPSVVGVDAGGNEVRLGPQRGQGFVGRLVGRQTPAPRCCFGK